MWRVCGLMPMLSHKDDYLHIVSILPYTLLKMRIYTGVASSAQTEPPPPVVLCSQMFCCQAKPLPVMRGEG